jgi:hypothetical protein
MKPVTYKWKTRFILKILGMRTLKVGDNFGNLGADDGILLRWIFMNI